MADREGTLVGVWLNDAEIERLDSLAHRLGETRLITRKNRSETLRSLVRIYEEGEVVSRLVASVVEGANAKDESIAIATT